MSSPAIIAAIFSAFFFSLPSCETLFCVTLSSFMDFCGTRARSNSAPREKI